MPLQLFSLIIPMLLITGTAFAQPAISFSSSDKQVSTIELFTSHGCSSCPPADKWLRQFVDHPGLWTEVIPMAFHVDYWDYLGWPDEFADPQNTRRQQNYAVSGNLSNVYTPGLVVKGQEWRGFFRRQQPDLSSNKTVGILKLETDLQSAQIKFTPSGIADNRLLTAHLAVLGFGIQSDIGAGENRGRVLSEDFVVLEHSTTQIQNGNNQWELSVPSVDYPDSRRLAIVAWVNTENSPAPLQATGGWLPSIK